MIAPYARIETAILLVGGAAATALVGWYAGWYALIPALVAAALLAFYRDPPRRVPDEPSALLAPADGRVIAIERNLANDDGGPPLLRILIFLSVLDVHLNRSPCAGRVLDVRYRPGKFANAMRAESALVNESNTVVLAPTSALPGPIAIRQIAGLLARRIVCVVKAGDVLAAGERYGMIKLGSQTEITAPDGDGWDVQVGIGSSVFGGVSVLARWSPPAQRNPEPSGSP